MKCYANKYSGFFVLCLALLSGFSCRAADSGPRVTVHELADGQKIETTIDYALYMQSIGIADKLYNGAWGQHSIVAGEGSLLRLYKREFMLGTFDGQVYHEMVFQLPVDIEVGAVYSLQPIPADRPVKKLTENISVAPMQAGELTVFKFSNPVMEWMAPDAKEEATLKIIDMTDQVIQFSVHLRIPLERGLSIDMDEQVEARVIR